MAIQTSVAVGNAALDSYETTVGNSSVIKIRTGAPPANCAAADSGTVLSTVQLAADWSNPASGRSKTLLGAAVDAAADASGTAGHFRQYASDGTTCHMQGTVTFTGGGGDMTVDAAGAVFTLGQQFTITSYTLNGSNA